MYNLMYVVYTQVMVMYMNKNIITKIIGFFSLRQTVNKVKLNLYIDGGVKNFKVKSSHD